MINVLYILLSAGISGFLYWAGGHGKPYHTLYRDLGIPLLMLGIVSLTTGFHWSLLLSCLLTYGALTTYWKCLNKYFNKPTTDAYWFNWIAHGLGIGLAFIPYAIYTHTIIFTIIRAIVLGLSMMIWSKFIHNKWDERGRGALIFLVKLIK